jgi:hypothetical protein
MYRRGHSLPLSIAVSLRNNRIARISRFGPIGNIQLTAVECNLAALRCATEPFDAEDLFKIPTNFSCPMGHQRIFVRGLKCILLRELVARTGVEPVIFALKGRRVNHYSTGPHGITRGEPSVLEF